MSATLPNLEQEAIIRAPIDTPLKVIAGAGTGKTHTLTNRFVHLAREEGIPAEQILAITFTEKAAAEMSARIRGALARDDQPVEHALAIHTFHAFAGRLLREYPEAAGVPPDFTVLSELPQRLVLRRAFRDATEGKVDVDGLRLEDLVELDVKSLEDIRRITHSVISKAKGHGWSPEEFERQARERDERFYNAMPGIDRAEELGPAKRAGLSGEVYDAMREAGFPGRDRSACLSKGEANIRKLYFTGLKDAGSLRTDEDSSPGEQRHRSALALRTITALFREYNRRLEAQGALDFDDLVLKAVAMLAAHPAVNEAVRQRYRYILVDEFQDTSPVQMDLIRAVAVCAPCPPGCPHPTGAGSDRPVNVTIVGDKKQAIYGWRNARKENLDELIPCLGEDVVKPLSRNYRSAPVVINLANEIGARVEPDDPALEPHRETAGRFHVPALFSEGKARHNKAAEAAYIAERVQALAADGTRYADMAVLLRRMSQFEPVREAFRRRNIPYVVEGSDGLFEEPVAKDALCALRAIARPEDDLALYRLLSRPLVGLSDAELVGLRYRGGVAAAGDKRDVRPLSEALERAPDGTAAADLRERLEAMRINAGCLSLPDLLEALPALAGFGAAWDADDRALWPQVLAMLQAAAWEAEGMAPAASVEDLLDLLDAYDEEDGATLPIPPNEAEGVRVMTIHKAKGLEFPVVFVPSIASRSASDSGWIWDDDWGLLPDFAEAERAKRTVALWMRRKSEDGEDEEERCWYVAATRAADHLCVTGYTDSRSNTKNTLPTDLKRREPDPSDPPDWADRVTVRRREEGEAPDLPAPATEGARVRIPRTTSFSALSEFRFCPVASWMQRVWRMPDELITVSGSGGAGRRVGDLFHRAAALWYDGQREGLPDAVFGPDDPPEARDGVRSRWPRFIASPCASWAPLSVERRVHLRHPTAFGDLDVSGFIDLVLPDDGEGLTLADLKTNRRLETDQTGLYAMQLALYRMALIAAGERVAPTGMLVHVAPEGIETIRVELPDHEPPLRRLLEGYAEMVAVGRMPARPEGAPCDACAYRVVCPRAGSDGDADPAASADDLERGLFEEAWHPLLTALAEAGFSIEPGDEVRDGATQLVTSVGVVTGPDGAITLIDADDERAEDAVASLTKRGERAVALRTGDTLEDWRTATTRSE